MTGRTPVLRLKDVDDEGDQLQPITDCLSGEDYFVCKISSAPGSYV